MISHFKKKLLTSSHSRVNLPWFKCNSTDDDINKIHRKVLLPFKNNKVIFFCYFIFWPFLIQAAILTALITESKQLKKRQKINYSSQLRDLTRLCFQHNYAPMYYYQYKLWRKISRPAHYLQEFENIELQKLLNIEVNAKTLTDKNMFSQFCRQYGFPSPKILATYQNEKLVDDTGLLDNYKDDVFIKPLNGVGGENAALIQYIEKNKNWTQKNNLLAIENLKNYCRSISKNSHILIQERIKNHISLNYSKKGALCTIRLVTTMEEHGAEMLFSAFRIPTGNSDTDNFGDGGIACNIINGVLTTASSMLDPLKQYINHPDTSQLIEGQKIPFYDEAILLANTAHQKLEQFKTIGWDIAITDTGPSLIEGNPIWGVQIVQITTEKAILDSQMKKIYMSCLN